VLRFIPKFGVKQIKLYEYFYRCAVHSVVYLITHTNICTYIYIYLLFKKSKIYITTF